MAPRPGCGGRSGEGKPLGDQDPLPAPCGRPKPREASEGELSNKDGDRKGGQHRARHSYTNEEPVKVDKL